MNVGLRGRLLDMGEGRKGEGDKSILRSSGMLERKQEIPPSPFFIR
jgi:hypothetical protein